MKVTGHLIRRLPWCRDSPRRGQAVLIVWAQLDAATTAGYNFSKVTVEMKYVRLSASPLPQRQPIGQTRTSVPAFFGLSM